MNNAQTIEITLTCQITFDKVESIVDRYSGDRTELTEHITHCVGVHISHAAVEDNTEEWPCVVQDRKMAYLQVPQVLHIYPQP